MFKIEIRGKDNNVLVKSKKYESESTFLKWKEKHTRQYSHVYNIFCFEFINKKWEPIK